VVPAWFSSLARGAVVGLTTFIVRRSVSLSVICLYLFAVRSPAGNWANIFLAFNKILSYVEGRCRVTTNGRKVPANAAPPAVARDGDGLPTAGFLPLCHGFGRYHYNASTRQTPHATSINTAKLIVLAIASK
jgi:hypothetical protein